MALTLTVTNAGRAALVNAANTGTAPVTIAQIGLSGTAVVPNAAATALPGEFKRLATLSGDVVADDTIHLIVRDESADVFTVRSLAMYLADGTLFGIYGQAAVLVEKSAQALMLIAVDVKFEDIAASSITFGDANFLNPPATTEMQGVVELATTPETLTGTDTQRAVTPKGFSDGLYGVLNFRFGVNNAGIWHPGNDGSGSGLDADLLDGQDGSYYANITARLGYTPLNKAGDTATGRITFNSTVTGNNGIATATTNLGEYEVRGSGTGAAMMAFHRPGLQSVYFGLDTDNNLKLGGWSLGAVAYKIWHAGNDGAGSGLDADLLDGQDGGYYSNIPDRLGYTPANRAGDTFTGRIHRDSGYYFDLDAGGPLINFAPFDYLSFDRANDRLSLFIGGASRMVWRGSGNLDMGATGGLYFNGNIVWHSGNDGSGSGLDADALDGQDGSYYTNIPARLGYTPVNKGGDTVTSTIVMLTAENASIAARPSTSTSLEVRGNGTGAAVMTFHRPSSHATFFGLDTDNRLKIGGWSAGAAAYEIWHAGNDGAGSGLDADLLDGQDGGYYSNITARLGYTPANKAGDTFNGSIKRDANFYIDFTAGNPLINFDANDYLVYNRSANVFSLIIEGQERITSRASGNLSFYAAGGVTFNSLPIWHSGNDGSGSGLDADTLDGFHASDLLRIISESKAGSGYMQLSNGLLLQWGRWTSSPTPGAAININFPVAFSAEPFTLVTMPVVTTSSGATTWSSDGITGASFPARCSIASIGCRYFAIGPV